METDEPSIQLTGPGSPEPDFCALALVGSGGSGDVFRARDRRSGNLVALKVGRGASAEAALAQEATCASLALSPHLPELVDVGWLRLDVPTARILTPAAPLRDFARPFVSLRWRSGRPVDPRAGPIPDVLALRIAAALGQALHDLHGVGIAHGDVKPENTLIADDGGIHLIDLGLSGPLHALDPRGATLRYLARGDADLGDGRARDLLALGVLLAELADDRVARAADPLAAARTRTNPSPLQAIFEALITPSPWARPSAGWVADLAHASLREVGEPDSGADDPRNPRAVRSVRAAYLRVRRDELHGATGADPSQVTPWLLEAIDRARRIHTLQVHATPDERAGEGALGQLTIEQRARLLTVLVGPAAASWPLGAVAQVPEQRLIEALCSLALAKPPSAWTLVDLEAELSARPSPPSDPIAGRTVRIPSTSCAADAPRLPIDPEESAGLAIRIARSPADALAILRIEQATDPPTSLVLGAVEALRLAGEHGRARSLLVRRPIATSASALALVADVLRRAGDMPQAQAVGSEAAAMGGEGGAAARAVLARIALDTGDVALAEVYLDPLTNSALYEVSALVRAQRGDLAGALGDADRSMALARTAEERARAFGLLGFVTHGHDPDRTHAAFLSAVEHAVLAGAVVEEATYRTGEAAAGVDLGALSSSIATSRRAALLWEYLGRPALAARALLATAAAYATAGLPQEATRAATEAIARAREGGDTLAQAYACWAIADVSPDGSAEGLQASETAAGLLESANAAPADLLRAGARILRHGALDPQRTRDLDQIAVGAAAPASAQLDWWGARTARAANGEEAKMILARLLGLADARAPIGARGAALAAGVSLAERHGHGEEALRLMSVVREDARNLTRKSAPDLLPAIRKLPWVVRAEMTPENALRPEQARDLESIIRSFSDREHLGHLLNRIVDVLVMWTGVERGLLLLPAPGGRLVPRAARNLSRADLVGDQLELSQGLAARASTAREPIVAVDAEGELGGIHQSVHALKLRSVLAVPLIARGEVVGVAYLDDRVRRGAFGPKEVEWAKTIASLAALVLADARDQVLLRRAARRAKRASEEIASTLSLREAALDAAQRELATRKAPRGTRFAYDRIIGNSAPMGALLRLLDRVAVTDMPVLVGGESGSGKELVARAIHENGPRKTRAFVTENCAAIPEGLLESELFGHVRGAFTGASSQRTGLFEVADRGTLFLDEIGDMSLGMQTKLLRVLEDGMVRPVGSDRARKVDVRIIAATNRDLPAMVAAKAFREDLFYRLNVIPLQVPPLRERADDIPLLAQFFLDKHASSARPRPRITQAAIERLMACPWPGNIRQLENEILRATVLADGVIDEEQLSPEVLGNAVDTRDLGINVRKRVDALERSLVGDALERTNGNQTQAAKLLGLSRFGLQKMMKRLTLL